MCKFYWLLVCLNVFALQKVTFASPFLPEEDDVSVLSSEDDTLVTTETPDEGNSSSGKDLYIIRKVVYEIGILTDASNNSDYDNKTHEQIDVSFFDPADNGTFVDLSNIPIPVETNVSGVALTGIVSSNLGGLIFPDNGSDSEVNRSTLLLFPDKQVKVTKNISTVGKEDSANILSGLSDVLGLSKLGSHQSDEDDSSDSEEES